MGNIVIIGMPGAGKSTLGVILAKALGWGFCDTDLLIQERTGRLLQEIIDRDGVLAFEKAEEDAVLSLSCTRTVIATGGSVVYSRRAMEHLQRNGLILYLRISCNEMVRRLGNIRTRGVVLAPGQDLVAMYRERVPLYERYADIVADVPEGEPFEEVVERVIRDVEGRLDGT